MRQLLLCLLSFLFLTTNAQNSNKNNFLQSKTATEFFATHGGKNKKVNRIVRSVQISKTINVSTSGTLVDLLTPIEKNTITDLTVTGNLDARDFRILRDSMLNLAALDISTATVESYSGYGGTDDYNRSYSANEIPDYAFYISGEQSNVIKGLTTILLPSTVTSIGSMAFTFCRSLTSISISSSITQIGQLSFVGCSATINVDPANQYYSSVDGVLFDKAKTALLQCPVSITGSYDVPSTVNSIGIYGFCFCDKLTSVNIPSAVESIGIYAFTSCSGLITIDTNNPNYTSLDGVLFNKSVSTLIQCGTSKSGSYVIPSSVDSIGDNSFYNCSLITSLFIPSSVITIEDFAFYNCSGLTSITVNSLPVPLSSTYSVFYHVNTNTCILNVPFGTKSLYQSASGWNSFTHIVENIHGFVLETNKVNLATGAGSTRGIKISTNDAWTAVSNQNWLIVSPGNGSGNDTIVVTAEANPSTENRIALVTVSDEGIQPQTITIIQAGLPLTINITAGKLSTVLTAEELSTIINLKITGTMDASDFKTLRDDMPALSFLDMSEATIAPYNGLSGTASWITTYSANKIPDYAFNVSQSSQKSILTILKLPATINAIGDFAFYSCQALTEITIPNSVANVGTGSFASCSNLTNIVLSNQLTSIENQAFMGCGFSGITIPTSVNTIGQYGFSNCKNLKSIEIPNSVTTILNSAFENCNALTGLTIGSS
ncbi:MAG TPA: leucine-rich repeat protein, partial [Paludibacter sp.]